VFILCLLFTPLLQDNQGIVLELRDFTEIHARPNPGQLQPSQRALKERPGEKALAVRVCEEQEPSQMHSRVI